MTDEELRDLQERVQTISDMTASTGWAMLQDAAKAVLVSKQTRIIQGKCDNYEEYKTDCAFGDGVLYLINLPDRLQMRLDQELELRSEAAEEAAELV